VTGADAHSRRELVAGAIATIGGCLGSPRADRQTEDSGWSTPSRSVETIGYATATSDGPTGGHWPQFGYDGANSGHAPAGPVPTGAVEERWRSSVPGDNAPHAPALDDGVAVMQSGRTELAAYDLARGRQQWIGDLGARTYGFSPAIRDGVVYAATAARNTGGTETADTSSSEGLQALSLADGDNEWTSDVRPLSSPVLTADGLTLAIQPASAGKAIVHIDPADGTERWRYTCSEGCTATTDEIHVQPVHVHRPAVVDGRVIVASADTDETARLRAIDDDGTVEWTRDFDAPPLSPPVVGGDTVFVVVGNTLQALDPETGAERWEQSLPSEGPPSHLMPATDGTAVYTTAGQSVLAYAVADGTEQWRVETGAGYQSTLGPRMAVGETHLLLAWKSVTAIERSRGEIAWRFQNDDVHHAQYTGPALADGGVVVGSCIKMEPGDYYDISIHQLTA
jgi:outer membrane protein assembly factor BamB